MAYSSYLIKIGSTAVPLSLIRLDTYDISRKVLDAEAGRDTTGVLHRTPLRHAPITIDFEIPYCDSVKMEQFMAIVRAAWVSDTDRTMNVNCFVPELNGYVDARMYMADPAYRIHHITPGGIVVYDQMRISLIEY